MMLYYSFLFLGLTLCQDNNDNYKVYDININENYNIDFTKYEEGKISTNSSLYFRMKINSIKAWKIHLTTLKNSDTSFKVDVCCFSNKPTDQEIYDGNELYVSSLSFVKTYSMDYDKYEFKFSVEENVKYVCVEIQAFFPLDYLDIIVTDTQTIKSKIYNITYSKEYELNSTDLENEDFIFKTLYEEEKNGIVQLKINKNYSNSRIKVKKILFEEEPKDIDDITNETDNSEELVLHTLITEGNYSTLIFPFENLNGLKYLIVRIFPEKKLDYLSVYIGPKKMDESNSKKNDNQQQNYSESTSNPIWLIILIVVLYIIIIVLIFYFNIKMCGCIKEKEIINEITEKFSLQPE